MAQLIADQAPGRDGVRRYRSPLEPLELHPVRLDRGVAAPALVVRLVVGEVALEPFDVAVALEGEDVGRDPVAEEADSADDQVTVCIAHECCRRGCALHSKALARRKWSKRKKALAMCTNLLAPPNVGYRTRADDALWFEFEPPSSAMQNQTKRSIAHAHGTHHFGISFRDRRNAPGDNYGVPSAELGGQMPVGDDIDDVHDNGQANL
jgi:hypothetical protein